MRSDHTPGFPMSSALVFPLIGVCVVAMVVGWLGVIRLAYQEEGKKAMRLLWGPLWVRYAFRASSPDTAKLGVLYVGGLVGLVVLALTIGFASGSS